MKIKLIEDELLIEETPGCVWIFGLFFAVIGGVFVYGSLGGFSNRDEVPQYAIYLSFLMGAAGIAVGIWLIYLSPITKVVVNRQTNTVVHTRRGLAGKQENIYSFQQIKQFCLIEEVDDDGDPIWSLGMELSDGETIVISARRTPDEKYNRDFVFQTNEFMHKQISSTQMVFEIEVENPTKAG